MSKWQNIKFSKQFSVKLVTARVKVLSDEKNCKMNELLKKKWKNQTLGQDNSLVNSYALLLKDIKTENYPITKIP